MLGLRLARSRLNRGFTQAFNLRRVLQCPGSPRFHLQKAVRWLPLTEGDRGCALQLQFPGPMTWSALADGHVPKIPHLWGAPKFPGLQLVPVGLGSGTAAAGGLGWVWTG